ncbi:MULTISPECIES: ABC transporter ATP-binding protein [Rhodopseudomonas]|uniref:ABC transporter ATP-binding protein n=1 Tax=Rhodopseudomonas palustris TaxID=1076 RepID=A0A0D7F722_RHOPL|nr:MULTISPECIES: ABC transporter ATP-binding protein [Rhodopseudomonas]KIZ47517.1 ABC transporter ATP-binding protein [Rhodopseudomonas palustris]MDF3811711.1 ABC transporter ATP-binding protein [Rhodopseudomonas sp. BAL398]WOK17902.1 ABC transporter ATP-binding protein [Rhodopseudomonas sp. BAL398]
MSADAASLAGDAAPIIALRDVSKLFDNGQRYAIRDINLNVSAGSFVAVVGGSGSGKTTLLKTINRLIEPESGTVTVEGLSTGDLPAHELRRRIGYVFQGIGLFPHMTVAENIGITPSLLKWNRADIAARVTELLDLVELPADFGQRMPDALSGGQRQRVGVARALAARPGIMLMDEPFGALDPITRDTIGIAYRRLHDVLGLTSLMVTHDVLEAILLADRIVVVRDGAIVADGTPHALLSNPPDDDVRTLMDMPARQAERVRLLLADEPDRGH